MAMTYERDSKKPIYISTEVFRALWLLAKADKRTERVSALGGSCLTERTVTPDEIADSMLRKDIQAAYPELIEHQNRVDKLQKELIASLSKKAGETDTGAQ